MGRLSSKYAILVSLTLIFFISVLIPLAQATIVVKPGKLDHFAISVLSEPVAGEFFLAKIEAYDAHGNFITEYSGPGEGFQISVSGQAKVTPSVIKARDFSGGLVVKIVDEKAEDVELSVLEIGGNVPITSIRFAVSPNKLDHFDVTTVKKITAGETFQARLVARDVFGNLIPDFTEGSRLRIEFTGRGAVKSDDKTAVFKNGESAVNFQAEKAGDLKITVRDNASTSTGQSKTLEIVAAKADHFSVVAPRTAVAGEKFSVSITAFDQFENIAVDFDKERDTVLLYSSSGKQLIPSSFKSSSFHEGNAVFKVTYEKAESFEVIAEGKNNGVRGVSEVITVSSAEPDHFVLETPNTAVAGESFPVIVQARDKFNNMILDYHLIGSEVYLRTDGTGELTPSSIAPSQFENGKAEIVLTYSKAESFNLIAELKVKAKKRKTSKEISDDEQKRLQAEKVQKELQAKIKAEREQERIKAMKAKEEALKAKEKAGKIEEPKPKAVAPQPSGKVAAPVKAAPEKVEEVEKTISPAKVPSPKMRVAKQVVRKLENISMMESKDQAVIILKLSGPVSYDVSLTSEMAQEWIYVEFNPAEVDRDKVVGKMITESALIGQIRTKDLEDNKVEVAIEVLPKNITYTAEQDDKAIVIKVTKAK